MSVSNDHLQSQKNDSTKIETKISREEISPTEMILPERKVAKEISPIIPGYKTNGTFGNKIIEDFSENTLLCIHYNILGWYFGFYEHANQKIARAIYDSINQTGKLEEIDPVFFRTLHINDYKQCVERAIDMGVKDKLQEIMSKNKIEMTAILITKIYSEVENLLKQYIKTFTSIVKPFLLKKLFITNVFEPKRMVESFENALNSYKTKNSKIDDLLKILTEKSKMNEKATVEYLKQFSTVNPKYRITDSWLLRKNSVIAALKRDAGAKLNNTVFSLNEVTIHQFYDIYSAFKETHEIIGFDQFKSPNSQGEYTHLKEYDYNIDEGKGPDFIGATNLILIPKNKFIILSSLIKMRWISENPDKSQELDFPRGIKGQRNIILEVGVKDKQTGEQFIFLSTHFTPIEQGLPFSAEFLAKEIKSLKEKHNCPIIALGDLNPYDDAGNKENVFYGRQAYATLLNSGLEDACTVAQSRYHQSYLEQNTFMGFKYDSMSLKFDGTDKRQAPLDHILQPDGEHNLPVKLFFKDPVAVTQNMQLIALEDESAIRKAVLEKNTASDHMLLGVLFEQRKRSNVVSQQTTLDRAEDDVSKREFKSSN